MTVSSSSLNIFPAQDNTPALSDLSPKDKPWDKHKAQSLDLSALVGADSADAKIKKMSLRMGECSTWLLFRRIADGETGEIGIRLKNADFCRVRVCPICQWRRSLMYQARYLERIESVLSGEEKLRFLFLTLTVPNVEIPDLRATLGEMRKAWQRLVKREEFGIVKGWIRATEVTRGADGSAHPHYHCLLLVPPSYFNGREYVKQTRWGEVWTACMRAARPLIVDVRAVKKPETIRQELLKYATKPGDLGQDPGWTVEYIRQVHKLRFIESGGILKGIFKDEKGKEELIRPEGEEGTEIDLKTRHVFGWSDDRYRLRREYRDKKGS